jgi:ABC-type uncharacterized transport system substrate-binding protein
MKAKILVYALPALILTIIHLAEAQQPKIYHLGVLTVGSPVLLIKGLRDGLKDTGYNEGKNLVLEIPAKESYEELRPVAKAFVEKKYNLIVSFGATSTLIAKELTQEIPILFVGVADPMGAGLVKSFSRPEANVTGVTGRTDFEMNGKRLEIFKEAVPTLQRVAVLYNARGENPTHTKSLALVQKVAPTLGLKLAEKPIKSSADIEEALSSVSKRTADGLFLICATLFRDQNKRIASVAIQKRLAFMGCEANATEIAGLLGYSSDSYRVGHRGAWYVDRLLKGTKPQDLPVETPTSFELIINLKNAKQIGLTIPPNVLARADKVIR